MSSILTIPQQEAIIASLALDHDVLEEDGAIALITRCRQEGLEPLTELLATRSTIIDLILQAVAYELGYEFFDMARQGIALKAEQQLLEGANLDALERYAALPMATSDAGIVVVAIGDPTNPTAKSFLAKEYEKKRGLTVRYVLANPGHIRRELSGLRTKIASDEIARTTENVDDESLVVAELAELEEKAESSPIVKWVSNMLESAVLKRASDIHIDPLGDGAYQCLFRVDGMLQRAPALPKGHEQEVIAQIAVRASLDIAKVGRKAMDGRLRFSTQNRRRIDGRVNIIPQISGPKVTIRLLDPANLDINLEEMGLSDRALSILRQHANRRQGAIFVSGPTGSGKTTTLYSLLREIMSIEKNIMTVEDPVEYQIRGLNQVQVDEAKGITYADTLKAILRSDPDVILVGETRDEETARTVASASITGHLVLTTIHAPSAIEVFTRFVDMGVPVYNAAEAISVTTAQRLLRRVCSCAEQEPPTDEEKAALEHAGLVVPDLVMHTRGCGICSGVGYRGRVATAEVLEVNRELSRLLAMEAAMDEIRAAAADNGFVPLREDAFRHVLDFTTTVSEYIRTVDLNTDQ